MQNEIKDVLKTIPFVNISTDLWTDATVRPFNGYIAQGIDNDWKLHFYIYWFWLPRRYYLHVYKYNSCINLSLFIIFIGRHTGEQIKTSYDQVVKFYDVQNKVFKIVADQGANIKKGFRNERECEQDDEIVKLTNEMLLQQKKKDFKQKQDILRQSLEEEIAEMNIVTNDEGDNDGMNKSREQVLA